MSGSNCCFVPRVQISQEAGKVVLYSHLFKNFPQFVVIHTVKGFKNFPQFVVIHTVKGFSIVDEAEVDIFLKFSSFFSDPTDVGYLISVSSAFSKSSLNFWKFLVHILLKPSLENFEHYFVGIFDECSCGVVWAFFGIAFLWDWNENWPFPVVATDEFLSFIVLIFAWNVPLLSLIFLAITSLSHPIVFVFLCIDHLRRLSYLSLLSFGTLHSDRPSYLCNCFYFFFF